MNKWKGKVAVVTGASSGIGATIATKLVEEGLQVVGLARRKELVDELSKKLQNKPGKLHGIRVDMTKENEIIDAFKWVEKTLGGVHILINNAGILPFGDNVTDGNVNTWRLEFDTNVIGLCIATKETIRIMKNNKIAGHIIHLNSRLGHEIPTLFTGMGVYPATKYAVRALAESLRTELATEKSNIKVTNLSPGRVNTELLKNSTKGNVPQEVLNTVSRLNADDVANAAIYVLSTPPHVCISELIIQEVGELL